MSKKTTEIKENEKAAMRAAGWLCKSGQEDELFSCPLFMDIWLNDFVRKA